MNTTHAVENNIAWYRAVLGAHGVGSELTEAHWCAASPTPPYYSNLVTRTAAGAEAQMQQLAAFAADPPEPSWGFKDAFASLDPAALEALGLRPMFDARWYGLDVKQAIDPTPETSARFVPADTSVALAQWETSWQVASPVPEPGMRIFPPAILDNPAVRFVALRDDDEAFLGGVAFNESHQALGLSNFFTLGDPDSAALLRDAFRHARQHHPTRHVVGYGPPEEAADLVALGVRDLGPLRVWVAVNG